MIITIIIVTILIGVILFSAPYKPDPYSYDKDGNVVDHTDENSN